MVVMALAMMERMGVVVVLMVSDNDISDNDSSGHQ